MVKAIEVDRVTKHIGKRKILDNISFSVEQGDAFGYLGPNGAGKTTTIRVLLNLLRPSSGSVKILGHDAFKDPSNTKKSIGFVLEADGLYENMTAIENLQYYGEIYGVPNREDRAHELLSLMTLNDRADDKVSEFSKGMRQRLALARAMIHDPAILILDEPTAGVDPTGQLEVRSLILDLAHTLGKTVFLSSHNLDELQRICNRIALIHKGQIRLWGDLEELRNKRGRGAVMIDTAEEGGFLDTVALELRGLQWVEACDRVSKGLSIQLSEESAIHEIVSLLSEKGVRIEGVGRVQASLEEIYASMINGKE